MGVVAVAVLVDGRGGEEPVWVRSRVVGVGANAQGHLVNYSTSLRVRETEAVLEERSRSRRQDRVGVVGSGEGAAGWVGQQGVWVQALCVRVRGG